MGSVELLVLSEASVAASAMANSVTCMGDAIYFVAAHAVRPKERHKARDGMHAGRNTSPQFDPDSDLVDGFGVLRTWPSDPKRAGGVDRDNWT